MSLVEPRWRTIPEFPGYEVCENGDVRCWTYRGIQQKKPRTILPYLSNSNRWAVKMMRVDETTKRSLRHTMSLGVLVLRAFCGNPGKDETDEVDFKDGNPYNVNLSNLKWRKSLQRFKEL